MQHKSRQSARTTLRTTPRTTCRTVVCPAVCPALCPALYPAVCPALCPAYRGGCLCRRAFVNIYICIGTAFVCVYIYINMHPPPQTAPADCVRGSSHFRQILPTVGGAFRLIKTLPPIKMAFALLRSEQTACGIPPTNLFQSYHTFSGHNLKLFQHRLVGHLAS